MQATLPADHREALALRDQPHGPYLLGLVGLGLVAYAFYSFVAARHRHIPTG